MSTFLLQVRQGDTKKVVVTYKDSNNVVVDMTGYTFELHVAVGESLETYTGTPEVLSTDLVHGIVTLVLSATQTGVYDVNGGTYYFKVTAPNGDATTLLKGDVDVDLV